MKNLDRDSIDFGKTDVKKLFVKLFVPTLLGLVFTSAFNIIDGVVVGQGVGSNALAAVNVAAPIYLIASAIGLLFATGVSIVAAVHLSQNNEKAANINVTQAFFVPLLILIPITIVILVFAEELGYLFGGSELLSPLIVEYMRWACMVPIFDLFVFVGIFVVRLDGSPNFAMVLSIVGAFLNSVLDCVFVFPLQWGLMGAAFATSISLGVESLMVFIYMIFYSKKLKFRKIKLTPTSITLTFRNIGYMAKLGFPTAIGEVAILFMLIVGNNMFMSMLHEDGVAAFSVCCYLFPLVFMFGSAIAQAQLPIISYNYGQSNWQRIRSTFKLSLVYAVVCGLALTVWGLFFNSPVVALFLKTGTVPYELATTGLSYFSLSFIFFTLNLVLIGYYQSIEKSKFATAFMLLRGAVILVPVFIIVPNVMGELGLWLAVPISEAITFVAMTITTLVIKENNKKKKEAIENEAPLSQN